jgi:hypothetical protein
MTNCEAGANWAAALKRLELLDRSAELARQSSGSGGFRAPEAEESSGSGGIQACEAMSVAIPSMEEPLP